MSEPGSRIFRSAAVRNYREGQRQATLPRSATPRAFAWLWLLLALLLVALVLTWAGLYALLPAGSAVATEGFAALALHAQGWRI